MKGKRWVLTAAMLVAGLRLWMQVRGKTKTPFGEWAVGWGVLFFFLAMMSEAYPQAAGPLAGTIVVGDFLANGTGLFTDLTGVVTGATKGSTLVDKPFAAAPAPTSTSSKQAKPGHPGASTGGPAPPHKDPHLSMPGHQP